MAGLFGSDYAARIAARMTQEDYDPGEAEDLFAISVRVPDQVRATLDEMAKRAGVSRNSMIIELLRAGIQDVFSKLPNAVAQELTEEIGGAL